MLTPQQVIDTYYLDARCMLLEIAATMDRYDAAVNRTNTPATDTAKLDCLRKALAMVANPDEKNERTRKLLELFASV